MFDTVQALLQAAQEAAQSLHEVIIEEEMISTGKTRQEILDRVQKSLNAMQSALDKGNTLDIDLPIKEEIEQSQFLLSPPIFLSKDLKEAVYWAMSMMEYSNGMGVICAAPTAGACGVVPATLFKARQMLGKSDADLQYALIVGACIGSIIGNNASLSGSEAGCQAEVGVASAMAAASITHLAGGTPSQVAHAVAMSMKNTMGLVCDPVAGLVISPCIKRNAMGVMNAFLAAEMALSGVSSLIPADEVIEAMYQVGQSLPAALKETGNGGIAATPTGKRIWKQIFGNPS
jgi:L-serine dehydratase